DLQERNSPFPGLPPIERQLWSNLWKTKTSPKLRHFLWRALSGALAVKERLRTRGIQLDTTCPSCGTSLESICHVLFHCKYAKEVWLLSGIPPPPSGFSQTSMFLNLHYLLACSKKTSITPQLRLSFPWVLWHIWKARNGFLFEQRRLESSSVYDRAITEAEVWLSLNTNAITNSPLTDPIPRGIPSKVWSLPPSNWLKCNVGASWCSNQHNSGASWIVRDSTGTPLYHSRRAFYTVCSTTEASLQSLNWTVLALKDLHIKRVILETSCSASREALLQPNSLNPRT
ncbi:hypothetical protein BRARA_F02304, partial [Brassica rapa]